VIVHDLDVLSACGRPAEAHAELCVDPDAELSGAIASERFQPVARWYSEIFQPARDLQLSELASRYRFDVRPTLDPAAVSQGFRIGAFERFDHNEIITLCVINVKRDALEIDRFARSRIERLGSRH
jgi:hypothetical protein